MVFNVAILLRFSISLLWWCDAQVAGYRAEVPQDQTSARANTLLDDADDIQRQLDNEARDRLKYGRPKPIWVFHIPTQFPGIRADQVTRPMRELKSQQKDNRAYAKERRNEIRRETSFDTQNWNYKEQGSWPKFYPACGGRSQSPVDLPYHGLVAAKSGRKMVFKNYDAMPEALKLINDGTRVIILGKWKNNTRPYIYGGAAHSRRYIFHSIILHWPSEHTVGGLQYPMESQAMHLSAEYDSMEQALRGSISDPQAFLAVSTLYKYANQTHAGLNDLITTAMRVTAMAGDVDPKPLSHFLPPFKEYACYQGSLTTPPCTEAVLWLVRARTLPVTREAVEAAHNLLGLPGEFGKVFHRSIQPMNDRKTYYFRC